MTDAYDCNYYFVGDPKQALVEAHEEIRELESQHAAEIARLRLTDAERDAIEWCLSLPMLDRDAVRLMPLRKLMERLT